MSDLTPLTDSPVVGAPTRSYPDVYVPGSEELGDGEVRVTVIGSGDPWPRRSQASGSLVVEVGNPERDFFFFFDLSSGALMNFTGLHLPVTGTTKLFLSHLHADHIGDVPACWGVSRNRGESIRSKSGAEGPMTPTWASLRSWST